MYARKVTILESDVIQPLGNQIVNKPLLIRAFLDNGNGIAIGGEDLSEDNFYGLEPGAEIYFKWVGDLSKIYVTGAAGDVFTYITLEE